MYRVVRLRFAYVWDSMICEGLTTVSQQLVLNIFEVSIAEIIIIIIVLLSTTRNLLTFPCNSGCTAFHILNDRWLSVRPRVCPP